MCTAIENASSSIGGGVNGKVNVNAIISDATFFFGIFDVRNVTAIAALVRRRRSGIEANSQTSSAYGSSLLKGELVVTLELIDGTLSNSRLTRGSQQTR